MRRIVTNGRSNTRIVEKELSYLIVGCFYETYNELGGYGFAESIYVNCLGMALSDKGLKYEREYPVEVYFRNKLAGIHKLDLLVEGRVIVELKATEKLPDGAKKQVVSYLMASGLQLGILLHFGPQAESHRILRPGFFSGPRRKSNYSHESDK
jgi:GxxExxY protein